MAILLTGELENEINELIIAHRKLDIPPPMVAKWNLQIDNKDPIRLLSQSWVRNAYNYCTRFWGQFDSVGDDYGPGTTDLRSTTGNRADINSPLYVKSDAMGGGFGNGYMGATGDASRGIVVGTGIGAESFESYSLGSLITHGVGSGQVSYSDTDIPVLSWDGINDKFVCTYTRRFLNNSGDTITINEIGLISHLGNNPYLFARDVLSPAIDLLDTQQLTVDYTLEFPYP